MRGVDDVVDDDHVAVFDVADDCVAVRLVLDALCELNVLALRLSRCSCSWRWGKG